VPLMNHRIAILTNPTGLYMDTMIHIVDMISSNPNLDVVAVFSPEHGLRGDHQAETGDPLFYIDSSTRLPVFSAYNMSIIQMREVIVLMNITAVLVDMQDVGVRLYTFIWTMYDLFEATTLTGYNVSIIVTDRPNPLGSLVDGPLVNISCCRSGYGRYPIPFLHGMTIGELAMLFQHQLQMYSVTVIKMLNWNRHEIWRENTGSQYFPPWVPPSPNLPTVNSALAYGSTVFLEATTVTEGRGTTLPFELFGAPFVNAEKLADRLNDATHCSDDHRGFRSAYFTPTWFKYNNTVVSGVQWLLQRTLYNTESKGKEMEMIQSPFLNGVRILCAFRDLSIPRSAFQWDGVWFGHPGTELIDEVIDEFSHVNL